MFYVFWNWMSIKLAHTFCFCITVFLSTYSLKSAFWNPAFNSFWFWFLIIFQNQWKVKSNLCTTYSVYVGTYLYIILANLQPWIYLYFIGLLKDSHRYGRNTPHWYLKIWNQQRNNEIILASFEHPQKLYWFSKFSKSGGWGSKIKPAMPILGLLLKSINFAARVLSVFPFHPLLCIWIQSKYHLDTYYIVGGGKEKQSRLS